MSPAFLAYLFETISAYRESRRYSMQQEDFPIPVGGIRRYAKSSQRVRCVKEEVC